MKLSVLIPVRNEEEGIEDVVRDLEQCLMWTPHETVIVNDHSTDNTTEVLDRLRREYAAVRVFWNIYEPGIGNALRRAFKMSVGDCVAPFMGDGSDSGEDLVRFYNRLMDGDVDCVFGDRWSKPGLVSGYPTYKQLLNRHGNELLHFLFPVGYRDFTNIFKLYKRRVWQEIDPRSGGFEIGLELSLSVVKHRIPFAILDNTWMGRDVGCSKMKVHRNAWRCLKTTWVVLRRSSKTKRGFFAVKGNPKSF